VAGLCQAIGLQLLIDAAHRVNADGQALGTVSMPWTSFVGAACRTGTSSAYGGLKVKIIVDSKASPSTFPRSWMVISPGLAASNTTFQWRIVPTLG
jgi:hypothetical protein